MGQIIAVIDYGMGNLHSVARAIEHVCDRSDCVEVTDDPARIAAADRVVFPGQGAARDCMASISSHQLNQAILKAARERPFLGICMGLQVLLETSEENEGTRLLGLFGGEVRRFQGGTDDQGNLLKIPHMGWSQVRQTQDHPLWEGIADEQRFYFVHSYHAAPNETSLIAGSTDYGVTFASAIARGNLFATQFHPEKSADAGLQLLRNFVHWSV